MLFIQLTLYLFTDIVLFFKNQKPIHMNTISKNQNRFGVFFNMLPNEILFGFKQSIAQSNVKMKTLDLSMV